MPPHPTDACYCHVVAAGVRNIQRLAAAGDLEGLSIEVAHTRFVVELLDSFLLYHGTPRFDESMHRRYWDEVRGTYQAQASSASLAEMEIPWDFLAHGLGFDQEDHRTPGQRAWPH